MLGVGYPSREQLRGRRGPLSNFFAPLRTTVVPTRGAGSATFTRATTATVVDFEGLVRNVLSGEVRFQGARRVYNRHLDPVSNLASWNKFQCAAVVSSGTGPGGADCVQITTSGTSWQFYLDNSTANNTYAQRCWMKGAVGGEKVRVGVGTTITLTTSWVLYGDSWSLGGVTQDDIRGGTGNTGADVIYVYQTQSEDVTGQANTYPAGYVSRGAAGSASPYHGAMVDGVKYFDTQNGNTVASNVVTEATGAGIANATLLGYLSEITSTNICLQSENFGVTWAAALGTPTRTAAALRCGAVALDLLGDDDAAVIEGYYQTINFTGNATKAVSLFFAQGTSTSTVIHLNDITAPATRMKAVITWSGSTPTVTMSTGALIATDTLGNGVFRARMTAPGVVAANTNYLYVWPATDTAISDATPTGTVYVGGVQVENSTYCSSYIPTTTVTVTRNVDLLTYPATANVNANAGAAYAEFRTYQVETGIRGLISDTAAASVPLGVASAQLTSYDGTTQITKSTISANALTKAACWWSGSTQQITFGGAAPTSGAFAGSMGFTTIAIGNWQGSFALDGTIRNVQIWAQPLPDATLQAMTA